MGVYSALRNGLKYSGTFGHVVVLFDAIHVEEMAARTSDEGYFIEGKTYAEACFGDLSKLLDSDKTPKYIVKQHKAEGRHLPKIYIACGDKDSLLPANRDMVAFLKNEGIDVTCEVGPDGYEWDFGDAYIKKAIV